MSWRWIPPLSADGATQMAIDRWMLQQQSDGAAAGCVRLYRWSRPTLSLGRHQRQIEPQWLRLHDRGELDLVRRPSGGRAVLHAGEITYALACRPASAHRLTAYGQACHWLQEAFAAVGLPLEFGQTRASQAAQRGNCFASGTAADLVHSDGQKRIGSAQLWQGPCLLQHGSVLLAPPQDLWRAVFHGDPPDLPELPVDPDALEALLHQAAQDHLCGGSLLEEPLSAQEWLAIQALRDPQGSGLD